MLEELFLEKLVNHYQSLLLSNDMDWSLLTENCETLHREFLKRYGEDSELCEQVINLIDANAQLLAYRENFRFSLGISLGMEAASLRDRLACSR